MRDELEAQRITLQTINLLKAVRLILRACHDISQQTIANCWSHSRVNRPHQADQLLKHQAAAQQKEAIQGLQQELQQLERQQAIRLAMDIYQLLNDPDEAVEDSPIDVAEQIAQSFDTTPEESEDEPFEELPRVLPSEALHLLRQLRLHEEQSDDCNTAWLRSLDS